MEGDPLKPDRGKCMIRLSWAAAAASVAIMCCGVSVSNPAEAQASFDCRRASHPSEIAVCQNAGLAAVDRNLDAAFRAALKRSENPDGLRAEQRLWLRDLRNCGEDPFCLEETYADRIEALENGPAEADLTAEAGDGTTDGLSADRGSEAALPVVEESSAEPEMAPAEQEIVPSAGSRSDRQSDTPATVERESQRSAPEQTKRGVGLGGLAFGALFMLPILAVVGSLLVVRNLANHTMNRYNWPLILNWWNVLYLVGFLGGFFVGSLGIATGDAVPLGLGFFGAIWLIMLVVNIRKTDLMTGLAMTLIQPFAVFIIYMAMCFGRLWNQQYRRS